MKDSRAEASRWLRQAEHDLQFARLALRESFYAHACFLCQQSAEKSVKAVAYGSGERVVLGHSLVELLDRYGSQVSELTSLREQGGILDQYYVSTRYPNGLPGGVPFEAFGEAQAAAALTAAAEFLELAREKLGKSPGID